MDYNRTTMFDADSPRTRRRLNLIAAIIITIPCYCAGLVFLSFAPNPREATPTPSLTLTGTVITPITLTVSSTPPILTGTVTLTPSITNTPTATFTPTITLTPFQPNTNTPTSTLTFTPTQTPSNTPTMLPTNTPSNTPIPSATSTNPPTLTPTTTLTASPTAFGSP